MGLPLAAKRETTGEGRLVSDAYASVRIGVQASKQCEATTSYML